MYSIKDLLLFIKVAELQSFSNTAKCLNVSQATISRQIKELEETFGSDLIKRDSRTFELTQAGRILYETIKQDVTQIDNIMSTLKDKIQGALNSGDEPHGKLLVVIPPVIGDEILSERLPLFIRKFPDVNLSVIFDGKANLIEDGIDYAITNYLPTQVSYKVKTLITLNYKLYCTKTYADKYGVPRTLEEINDHFCAGYHNINGINNKQSQNSKTTIVVHNEDDEEFLIEMPENFRVNNITQNLKLIKSNEMICALNQLAYKESKDVIDLVPVLPKYSFGKTKFYSIKHPYSNDAAVREFAKFVEESIKEANVDK